jgi:von Willebrand factor type A domain
MTPKPCAKSRTMLFPAGVKFNLVMFGSSHQMMWPEARDVTDDHTTQAETWVQGNVNAHWGGTEILGALKAVFAVPISKGEPAGCNPTTSVLPHSALHLGPSIRHQQ